MRKALGAFLATLSGPGRFRFAPTPSGFLHAGNAMNFILTFLAARLTGSSILLRIDDLDAARMRPAYLTDIFESLDWLGLTYDVGPTDAEDFLRHWSQAGRMSLYRDLLNKFRESGCLYPCAMSRTERVLNGNESLESLRNQGLSFEDPEVAWRIKTATDFAMPDFIVRRRDGLPAYQVSSVADDLYFNITHVIRGEDLADSTRAQLLLAESLNLSAFFNIRFLHHPLVLDPEGLKLSKSAGATALKSMRAAGASPAVIFEQVARMLDFPKNRDYPTVGALLDVAKVIYY